MEGGKREIVCWVEKRDRKISVAGMEAEWCGYLKDHRAGRADFDTGQFRKMIRIGETS
jgi:hypothetical protein|tara:strand:- start:189 stop:362 length:174 start_codon:yes stop_codon:yes gene_type:complete